MNKFIIGLLFLNFYLIGSAQNVGIGTTTPNASALLDASSTTQGFLPPRMTYAQRNAIVNPAAGLIVYCMDCAFNGEMQYFNGTSWINMSVGIGSAPIINLPSVTIGAQVWTTKNLNVSTYRDGTPIPKVEDAATWGSLTTGAYCYYNNDSATYAPVYGKLYNWYAVHDPRGLAPVGWHVPSDVEWNILVKYLDPAADTICSGCNQSLIAGGAMKSTIGWNRPNTGATNSSGFSGLPGGDCGVSGGSFNGIGTNGAWWSSTETTEFGTPNACWYHELFYSPSFVIRGAEGKTHGFSVRCLRD